MSGGSRRCPGCGLINPATAQRCDCGLSFVDGSLGPALERKLSEGERRDRGRARALGSFLVVGGAALVARLAQVRLRDGYDASDLPVVVMIVAISLCMVVAGLALRRMRPRPVR
jgi:hypothetical protein